MALTSAVRKADEGCRVARVHRARGHRRGGRALTPVRCRAPDAHRRDHVPSADTHGAVRIDSARAAGRRQWSGGSGAIWPLHAHSCCCSESYLTWYFYAVDWRGPQLPAPFELLQFGSGGRLPRPDRADDAVRRCTHGHPDPAPSRRLRDRGHRDGGRLLVGHAPALPRHSGWRVAGRGCDGDLPGLRRAAAGRAPGSWSLAGRRIGGSRGSACSSGHLACTAQACSSCRCGTRRRCKRRSRPRAPCVSSLFGFGFYLLFMAMVYRADVAAQMAPPARALAGPALACRLAADPLSGRSRVRAAGDGAGLLRDREPAGGCVHRRPHRRFSRLLLIARSWLSSLERIQLRGLTITDPVSGAFNHRYLHERLAEEFAAARCRAPRSRRSSCSTSTTSRSSTGCGVTSEVTSCCGLSPSRSPHMRVPGPPSTAWAATSSPFCSWTRPRQRRSSTPATRRPGSRRRSCFPPTFGHAQCRHRLLPASRC